MNKFSKIFATFAVLSVCLAGNIFAQSTDVSIKKGKTIIDIGRIYQIDDVEIRELLKPKGKPLLVNFWATWCVPCREEFPELVELDKEYKGKIDFITISLDDLAEINRDVRKFLTDMKATMPSYLLKTNDENAVIGSISKEWTGGLPFTVLYNEKGEVVHTRQGKIKIDIIKKKLDELITDKIISKLDEDTQLKLKIIRELRNSDNPFQSGVNDATRDIQNSNFEYLRFGEGDQVRNDLDKQITQNHNVKFRKFGCKMTVKLNQYIKGYNQTAKKEIEKRFGVEL